MEAVLKQTDVTSLMLLNHKLELSAILIGVPTIILHAKLSKESLLVGNHRAAENLQKRKRQSYVWIHL